LYSRLYSLPDKVFARISHKADKAGQQLARQTEKYLARLAKQERKLQQKLFKKDSAAARQIFGDIGGRYATLQHTAGAQVYSSRLDSMQTVLHFLQHDKMPGQSPAAQQRLSQVLGNYARLQNTFNQTAAIKAYIKQRQLFLQQQLQRFGLVKELERFKKEVYYYRAQVDEYRRTWEDPSKMEAVVLRLANKIPAFRDFFRRNSMLGSMFRLPGSDPVAAATPIPGLQTRASIQQDMLQRFGSGPDVSRAVQQNIQSAQAQINQLKDKVNAFGGGSSDMDMPDFKPNSQRTKSFWKRIELGANVQSVRGNGFFPVTSDVALSAGYKLNDKSIIGIGASYKMGWGQSIRNISITHEGIGLRTFLEWKLKGSFWLAGGGELNYRSRFHDFQMLRDYSAWQKSALIGISKRYHINAKFRGNIQLLFDALHAQQVPRTQPVLFRVGYLLK